MGAARRVYYKVCEVDFNWKALHDNFCESYHLPTTHPQINDYYDDYRNTDFELYETGHNLMKMKGSLPSLRADAPFEMNAKLEGDLETWGLDPADFVGRAQPAGASYLVGSFHCNRFAMTEIPGVAGDQRQVFLKGDRRLYGIGEFPSPGAAQHRGGVGDLNGHGQGDEQVKKLPGEVFPLGAEAGEGLGARDYGNGAFGAVGGEKFGCPLDAVEVVNDDDRFEQIAHRRSTPILAEPSLVLETVAATPDSNGSVESFAQRRPGLLANAEITNGLPNKFGHGYTTQCGLLVQPGLVLFVQVDHRAWHGLVRYR